MCNLDECFALITCRSGKVFAKTLDEQIALHSSIPRSQWIAMYYIYTSGDITQKCLADKMAIREPTVARMLQKMESDGYLFRNGSSKDKRIKYLKLTQKGNDEFLEIMPIFEKFKEASVFGICQKDLLVFKKVLNKMVENSLNLQK